MCISFELAVPLISICPKTLFAQECKDISINVQCSINFTDKLEIAA